MKQNAKHSFETFLEGFIPKVSQKFKLCNQAVWLLETTGSSDAADLKAEFDIEYRFLFQDPAIYQNLLKWDLDPELKDPLLKRELNVLIRAFKQNQAPKELLQQIAEKEADLAMSYATFRPKLFGKEVSENDIRDLLKKETDPELRKAAWDASKAIGEVLAPQILSLVQLRNQVAKNLGYADYFQMQLELQEVDPSWLLNTFDDLAVRSDRAYSMLIQEIENVQSRDFKVPVSELGPWSWAEPFGQEDPLDAKALDQLVKGVDIVKICSDFYNNLGIDVEAILKRSDLYERPGKNQHAFCINIDRMGDVRTLNNVKDSLKWLETVLHELGHGVYELGMDETLPWLLKEPPHMISTEAMALIAGRQAYRFDALGTLIGTDPDKESLRKMAQVSLGRRQLIFSRWVLVMTAFESELYKNPLQDLNALWWHLVEKYQKIRPPANRSDRWDWATKYHIGLAPVYYFSYLLGEMFASAIQEELALRTGSPALLSFKAGKLLQDRLFFPGNRMNWADLAQHVTGKPIAPDAWVREFASP